MKYGVSAWLQIQATNLLPGKTVGQLSGQAQRLLGQQSLAPFAGLKVDVDAVRRDNDAKQGPEVRRKNGLVVWCGPNPTREMKAAWQAEAKSKYGLSEARLVEVDEELRQAEVVALKKGQQQQQHQHSDDLYSADPRTLPREVVINALLPLLRSRLAALLRGLEDQVEAEASGASSSAAAADSLVLLQELRALKAERERIGAEEEEEEQAPPPPAKAKAATATARAVVSLTASAATTTKPPPKKKKKKGETKTAAATAPRPKKKPSAFFASIRGADVDALAAMGFSRKRAQRALGAVGPGAVDEAVAWLLAN
jgi:hypothetical protein